MISYKIRVALNMLVEELNSLIEEYQKIFDTNRNDIEPTYIYDKLYIFFKEDLSFSNIPIFLKKEEISGRLIFIVDTSLVLHKRDTKTVGNIRMTFKFPRTVKKVEEIKYFLHNIEEILDKHNL